MARSGKAVRGWPAAVLAAGLAAGCGDDDGGSTQSCLHVASTVASGALFVPADPPAPLASVSGASPFAPGCGREVACGTVYVGSEVEPFVSINPVNAQNLVGTWQQDRWSNGGAHGLLAAFSIDGGQTWAPRQAPFSRCSGGNAVNGGDYARATDPWISFGPTGIAYWMAMTITDLPSGDEISAMRVSRSTDGGDTWEPPITLIQDSGQYFNDKNAITADPTDALYAYAVWDRLDFPNRRGPAYFARTTNAGMSWAAARAIYDPGADAQTVGNQIAVLSDGTLLNLLTEIQYGTPTTPDTALLRVIRSADHGDTWSAPVTIYPMAPIGARDPESGAPIRDGSILGAIAVGPDDSVWVAWQDSSIGLFCITAPCYGPRDGIALARSTDGGQTWSSPVLVNGDPLVQAFTPAIRVTASGTIGVSYYDLRDNTPDPATLLTSHWLATSADGVNWTEQLISGPFDLSIAPDALGLFLGDYTGLTSAGESFLPFFAQTRADLANRTDIVALPLPAAAPVIAKSARLSYPALSAPPLVPSGEWAWEVSDNIRRQRKHFPDRIVPDLPAELLR